MISMIAAMDCGRVIGRGNTIPWRIPADLKRFRALTSGHHVLMGRKTFESIGRPLPGRTNVVVSRQPGYAPAGVKVAPSIEAALAMCAGDPEPFVIGGGEIYRQFLPLADRIYLTTVDTRVDGGDATFPELPADGWILASDEPGPSTTADEPAHRYLLYVRRT